MAVPKEVPNGDKGKIGKIYVVKIINPEDIFKGLEVSSKQLMQRSSDASYLLDKKTNGLREEQDAATVELARQIIKKDGDLETKRGLLFALLEPFIPSQGELILYAFKTADEKSVMNLIDNAGPNKPTDSQVLSYKNIAQGSTREKAFDVVLEVDIDKAILIAIKAFGVNGGIDDALAWSKTKEALVSSVSVYHLADSLVYGLLNPPGALPKKIPPSELDSEIRSFLA